MTKTQNLAMESSRGGVRSSSADDAAADIVAGELLRRGYRVMERQALNAVLREQGFQQSGFVDQATAVQIGRLAGAGTIFLVNIYGKSTSYHRGSGELFRTIPGLYGFNPGEIIDPSGTVREVSMSIKMIDVQSAEVLWLANESARSRPRSEVSDTTLIREIVARVAFPPPRGGPPPRLLGSDEERPRRSQGSRYSGIDRPAIDQNLRAVQGRLRELGYDPGAIDGRMGEQTRTALRRFQLDHNLPQTGRPDPATKRALSLE